ncbi:MAG TPA: coproporphyrinogen-III oxidase family protein, partial [Bacteroidota bacterium]|nr:coproporphyrinogen-III oxidase family protein [Bacteroidota bacterium]
AVELAKEIGFTNINVDLIFALPNQTLALWKDNLQKAVILSPQHISAYNLIIERGTPLADMVKNNNVSPLSTDEEADLYEFTMEYLEGEGYEHYEVSNYAKPGFKSKHNANYWNRSNYLGFGPSSHSFWSTTPSGTNRRWWNVRSIKKYCEDISAGRLPIAGEEILNLEQSIDEFVMLGLRSSGVDLLQLKNALGVNLLNDTDGTIKQLIDHNLAVVDKQVLRLTQKGFLLCDEISKSFLSRQEAP